MAELREAHLRYLLAIYESGKSTPDVGTQAVAMALNCSKASVTKMTLRICRTLHREKGGRLVAGDTKTYAGTRKIVLPPSTAELLRTRKKASFSP